ncbi:MAG: Mur ligase family protein [Armatimonadota bacterium]|nr:Mur ligase family protein [Armatimonadota bacterium]MDR7426603.1 Mur ligase family protein [Armatimonadota bacterium]MDR7468623.1 Mur ligase family protein [Armatimonadota bacterium]MDR7473746.1 Mur ligase family protein [Armatimonadota bacterium]MDR7538129.1 Mur ligase family protein [Armatimonadota bacterium]
MTYQEALAYIYGLLGERPRTSQPYSPLKLERMRHLCALLDHPERRFPAVLVAGTKGKGSTAAMLAAMAQAAGLRVGLYTKPHLVDFRERIRVNGELITPREVTALMAEIPAAIAHGAGGPGWPPTYFEVAAALAFLHFARCRVDLAVVEVGIGGRLDATNVVEPVVAVITTIDYDHTDLLGDDLRAIAMEDAGIIRPRGRVVTVPQPPAALQALEETAAAQEATLVRVGREIRYRTVRVSAQGLRCTVVGRRKRYRNLLVPLIGRHQALNAAAAVAASELLGEVGFAIPEGAVRAGLAGLRWPARIEIVRRHPLVVVDVAHNPVSFRALRAALDETFRGHRLVLVIGLLGNKDLVGIARIIGPRARCVVATRAEDPRTLPAAQVAEAFRPWVREVHVVDDPVDAARFAMRQAAVDDLVCVTGSFHVAGPVRAHLKRLPAPPDLAWKRRAGRAAAGATPEVA